MNNLFFKEYTISLLKALAVIRDIPEYFFKGGIMFVSFFGAMILILYYTREKNSDEYYILAALYGVFYIVLTLFIIYKLLRFSRKVKIKDYDCMPIDLVVFRFLLFIVTYIGLNFGVFYFISSLLI